MIIKALAILLLVADASAQTNPPPAVKSPEPQVQPSAPLMVDFSSLKVRFQPPPPAYPPLAKIARIQGVVVVEIILDAAGIPVSAKALSGPSELRAVAEDYAIKWKFEPAVLDGKPVTARFKLTMPFKLGTSAPGASQPNGDWQTLKEEGVAFAKARDYGKAVDRFGRAAGLAPENSNLWVRLGLAHAALKQPEEAARAYLKAIQMNPGEPNAFNNLGVVYRSQERLAEAEAAFRQQCAINREDHWAHGNLGSLLLKVGRYPEAVKELQEACRITPKAAGIAVTLGEAFLRAGDTGKALEQFDKAVKAFPEATTFNDVAYRLAEANVSLDLALGLAQRSIGLLEAALAEGKLGAREVEQEDDTDSLAASWDTLGWIHFRMGELGKAESYLRAARALRPSAATDLHLGRVFQEKGDRDQAIRRFAIALNEERPGTEPITRLQALLGPAGDLGAEIQKHRKERDPDPTLKLAAAGQAAGAGEFYFVLAPGGRVAEVRLLQGPASLKSLEPVLARIELPFPFPGTTTSRLVLRGMVTSTVDPGAVSVHLLPCDAYRSRPGGISAQAPSGGSELTPMPDWPGKWAAWAGPEGVALGFTPERIQTFRKAPGAERGNQLDVTIQDWLKALSGASSPSLSAWALARRLEAGDSSVFPQYQRRMLDHLMGLSKPHSGQAETVIQEPVGLPSPLRIAPGAPIWKAILDYVRSNADQPLDPGIYAVWCYGTALDQKDVILELAARTTAPMTLKNPHSDPWNDSRFWIIVDWAMAWGTEADFARIEAALPAGTARREFERLFQKVRSIRGFWGPQSGGAQSGQKEPTPAGPATPVSPAQSSFSQMKVKLQPPPPAYPKEASARKMMTTLKVDLTIDTNGVPIRARLLPGPWLAFFGPTAVEYSLDWRFEPARVNGIPSDAKFLLTMPFAINH